MGRKMKNSNISVWEPIELRQLKSKLAKISCECLQPKAPDLKQDEGVQVELLNDANAYIVEQCTQVNQKKIYKDNQSLLESITKDVLCPRCFITMSILRGGVIKILKDQEAEIKPDVFSCDKASEIIIEGIDKSSSAPVLVSNVSNLTLCDYLSECSSVMFMPHHESKVKFRNQISFIENTSDDVSNSNITDVDVTSHKPKPLDCDCLQNFVNSIRPPLDYKSIFGHETYKQLHELDPY